MSVENYFPLSKNLQLESTYRHNWGILWRKKKPAGLYDLFWQIVLFDSSCFKQKLMQISYFCFGNTACSYKGNIDVIKQNLHSCWFCLHWTWCSCFLSEYYCLWWIRTKNLLKENCKAWRKWGWRDKKKIKERKIKCTSISRYGYRWKAFSTLQA